MIPPLFFKTFTPILQEGLDVNVMYRCFSVGGYEGILDKEITDY